MECKLKQFLKPGDIQLLCSKTNIHRNSISRYINNDRIPRLDHAYKIASALNKSVYEIWPPD
ncbi:helix-turn-helix domain-containing protein [Virgibacillus halodenitrificans]|uniref:helix-turn-helix transcriptional regulator n=1 Tax=Virgibacillus halodenitrificans TaxID=1482 RepID=UPI00137006FF|nr:helix-turn-helix transcriptional regulator [Virgibacillus halodenitrificans]MYL45080.1 helix-turn-helix domain-containing protein [Virgibacillus halodenitrificans]